MPEKTRNNKSREGLDFTTLDSLLGFQLRRAQLRVFQHFQQSAGKLGITPGQAGILMLINNNPDISQAALARAIGVRRATLGEIIADMETKTWVERHPSPEDKRSYALILSSSGKRFVKKVITAIEKHEQAVTNKLTQKEQRELLRLLLKLSR